MLRGIAGILEPLLPSVGAQEPEQSSEYRIDDLAREAGTSVRNVRVYQDRGLLPPPRKEGRTGWYSESHLARLNLINRMLDRGYTFATISELLTAAQYGMRVEEVLGADQLEVTGPDYVESTALSNDDLLELFGEADFDSNVAQAVDGGLLKREGQTYRIANPRLLEAAKLLHDAGVPMSEIIAQAAVVRLDLRDVADRFVGLVTDRFLPTGRGLTELDEQTIAGLAELINKARATVHDVVQSLLVDAMEESIGAALEEAAKSLISIEDDRVG